MDDEVTQILKKWNLNNPAPRKEENRFQNETFDSRTFTRPKRRIFNQTTSISETEAEPFSMESGVSCLNNLKLSRNLCNFPVPDRFDKSASRGSDVILNTIFNATQLAERRVTTQLSVHFHGLPEL